MRCVVLAHTREKAGMRAEALSLVFLILSSSLNEFASVWSLWLQEVEGRNMSELFVPFESTALGWSSSTTG